MEYKDTILPNEEQLKTLKNGYILAQKNSFDDLSEIYKKMLEERDYLLSQKLSSIHPELLNNLERCIENMNSILNATNKEKRGQKNSQNSFSTFRTKTASNENLSNDTTLENDSKSIDTPPQDKENEVEEILNDNAFGEELNQTEQVDLEPSPAEEQRPTQQAKRQTRGRPFRQNPLAKVFSNFPINFTRLQQGKERTLSKQSKTLEQSSCQTQVPSNLKPRNDACGNNFLQDKSPNRNCQNCQKQKSLDNSEKRPDNSKTISQCDSCFPQKPPFPPEPRPPFPPHHEPPECNPHKKLVTKELDIIRLILLYMALRPNCPYTYRLCTIAQDHLEILGEILYHNE